MRPTERGSTAPIVPSGYGKRWLTRHQCCSPARSIAEDRLEVAGREARFDCVALTKDLRRVMDDPPLWK